MKTYYRFTAMVGIIFLRLALFFNRSMDQETQQDIHEVITAYHIKVSSR